jgi:hypothetical protein
MTRFGLNINLGSHGLSYGAPLGLELHQELAARRVQVLRQNVAPADRLEVLIADHAGQPLRAHLLLPTLDEVYGLGRETLELGISHLGAAGFDVGVINEGSITGVSVDEAVAAMEQMQRWGDELGFGGGFYACSIPNLEPRRDFGWMRAFWPRLSLNVVCDFHRYPEIRYPWHVDDRHPWHQFSTLEQELEAVFAEARGRQVSISEFTHATVQRRGWSLNGWHPFDGKVTDQESADYLTDDLILYAQYGLTDAFVFQYNDGPDPMNWWHCQGIVDVNGNWKPQAECFQRARTYLGGTT